MMDVTFSSHTKQRLTERFIPEEQVREALLKPDKLCQSLKNPKLRLVKKIYFNEELASKHLLLIVVREKGSKIEILTIIDTANIEKYL